MTERWRQPLRYPLTADLAGVLEAAGLSELVGPEDGSADDEDRHPDALESDGDALDDVRRRAGDRRRGDLLDRLEPVLRVVLRDVDERQARRDPEQAAKEEVQPVLLEEPKGSASEPGGGNTSWNSTHASRGCSQDNLVSTGGAGLLYCFATN